MFHNTFKQLKTLGKEALSVAKAIRDDVRHEVSIRKQLKAYRKELLTAEKASEEATNAQARENAQV